MTQRTSCGMVVPASDCGWCLRLVASATYSLADKGVDAHRRVAPISQLGYNGSGSRCTEQNNSCQCYKSMSTSYTRAGLTLNVSGLASRLRGYVYELPYLWWPVDAVGIGISVTGSCAANPTIHDA